ncbi:Proteophosphoglycan ppg4 [Rhodotorula toruloides ATCC 204091]|nr:Proteophosphoglycan ppg4 [Rhodotorula toruloides ATCC 204091]
MLPYDGEEQAVAAPSTSDWTWDPRFSLYFNFKTKQWAKPLPNGEWEYAGGVEQEQANGAENGKDSTDSKDHGSNGEAEPYAVPEEQVWPGNDTDEEDEANKPDPFAKAPLLRLVVSKRPDPSVLPPAQTVASLDPSEPVSIGRDKSFERRIRLRELAVSKVHATLFWALDPETEDGGYWAVVDNGSTHGTFISSDRSGESIRLSEPKVASVPHRLHHLDTIRTGSTTFSVHIHPTFACSTCAVASDSSNLIPLVSAPSDGSSSASPAPNNYTTKTKEQKEQERREQMAGLKAKLLKPASSAKSTARTPVSHDSAAPDAMPAPKPKKAAFVDRAAARRQRDAGASLPSTARPAASPFFTVPGASSVATAAASSASAPKPTPPANPFSTDSKGAQLLSKLGGSASHTAPNGRTNGGLGTLIEARTYAAEREARPGLGSREPVVGVEKVANGSNGEGGSGDGNGIKRDWRDPDSLASHLRVQAALLSLVWLSEALRRLPPSLPPLSFASPVLPAQARRPADFASSAPLPLATHSLLTMAQPDLAKVLDAIRRAGMDTSQCRGIIYDPELFNNLLKDVQISKAVNAFPTLEKAFSTLLATHGMQGLMPTGGPTLSEDAYHFMPPQVPVDKLPDDFDFKGLGNELFTLRRDAEAVKAYTEGLARNPSVELRLVLRLNRAQVHLRLENFASAYHDSSFVLKELDEGVPGPSQARLKATLRLARAFKGMRHLALALEHFAKVIELDAGSKEGAEGKKRIERKLRETNEGEYDWRELEKQAKTSMRLDVGDFVGPVKLVKLEGRGGGRGLVATRDIQAGELLIVDKAIVVGEPNDASDPSKAFLFGGQAAWQLSMYQSAQRLASLLKEDPSLAPFVYSLHSRVQPATYDLAFESLDHRQLPQEDDSVQLDKLRLESICSTNGFQRCGESLERASSALDAGSGLHLRMSLLNHDCVPNTVIQGLRDVKIARARIHIKEGEEVCLRYIGPIHSRRPCILAGHFPDGCKCAYCLDEALDSPAQVEQRKALLGNDTELGKHLRQLNTLKDLSPDFVLRFIDHIARVERTYSDKRVFRLDLIEVYRAMSDLCAYSTVPAMHLAIKYRLASLEVAGLLVREDDEDGIRIAEIPFEDEDGAVPSFLKVASYFTSLDDEKNNARKWAITAFEMSKTLYSDDWDRFVERHHADVQKLGLDGLLEECRDPSRFDQFSSFRIASLCLLQQRLRLILTPPQRSKVLSPHSFSIRPRVLASFSCNAAFPLSSLRVQVGRLSWLRDSFESRENRGSFASLPLTALLMFAGLRARPFARTGLLHRPLLVVPSPVRSAPPAALMSSRTTSGDDYPILGLGIDTRTLQSTLRDPDFKCVCAANLSLEDLQGQTAEERATVYAKVALGMHGTNFILVVPGQVKNTNPRPGSIVEQIPGFTIDELPDEFDFCALGNRYFQQGDLEIAVKIYDEGLTRDVAPEVRLLLRHDRSQAHLRLANFASTYHDSSFVLKQLDEGVAGPPNAKVKATIRLGRAFEGMRHLTLALEQYKKALDLNAAANEAAEGLERVERKIRESEKGDYDWRKLEQVAETETRLDVGDFIGPIKLVNMEGRGGGRGVVATRDIEAGELLLVDKAIAVGDQHDASDPSRFFRFGGNRAWQLSLYQLAQRLAHILKEDPSLVPFVHSLHSKVLPASSDVAFGSLDDRPLPQEDESVQLGTIRLEAICATNSFQRRAELPERSDGSTLDSGSGLHLRMSLLDHACVPNAALGEIRDVKIARARVPIKQGEEVCLCYLDPLDDRRPYILAAHFPDGCKCAYCLDEKYDTEEQIAKRNELHDKTSPKVSQVNQQLSEGLSPEVFAPILDFQDHVAALELTYSPMRSTFRPHLACACLFFAAICRNAWSFDAADHYSLEYLRFAGAIVKEHADRIEVRAAPAFEGSIAPTELISIAGHHARVKGDSVKGRKWFSAAAEMSRIVHGDDRDAFVDRHAEHIKRCGLDQLLQDPKP